MNRPVSCSFEEFLDSAASIAQFEYPYSVCSLRAVKDGERTILCRAVTGLELAPTLTSRRYGQITMESANCSNQVFLSRLDRLRQTGEFPVNDERFSIKQSTCVTRQYEHSDNAFHEWPGTLYRIGDSNSGYIEPWPLVSYDHPPYLNLSDAVEDWTGVKLSDSDSRCEKLLVFVPNFQARLVALRLHNQILEIRTECESALFSVSIVSDGSGEKLRVRKPAEDVISVELPLNTNALRVYLINSSGTVVDFFEETQTWCTGPDRVLYSGVEYPKELVALIRKGETERVEFKPFIRTDEKKKTQEIIRAAAAFANTFGGEIIFGVSDEAEIAGVDHALPPEPEKAQIVLRNYAVWIRQLIADNLNRVPPVEVRSERVGDRTLIVVTVGEGTLKPYVNFKTNDVYIRRGANNVKADPETELKDLLIKQTYSYDFPPL